MPEGRRRAYAYAGLVAFVLLVAGIAGCGGGSTSTWRWRYHQDDQRELSGRHKLFVVERKRIDYSELAQFSGKYRTYYRTEEGRAGQTARLFLRGGVVG